MRALRLEERELEEGSLEWWERKYPLRSKVEIMVEGWPRRQRFGRITGIWKRYGAVPEVRVALPTRFIPTQKSWDNYFIAISVSEYQRAKCLDDIGVANTMDDADLWEYGIDLYALDVKIVGPPLSRNYQPPKRVIRL